MKKILVACPTASTKKYCFQEWLHNIMALNYPNYIVRVFDNSPDNGMFTLWMNKIFAENYGANNPKFGSYFVKTTYKNVNARIADSCNAMAQYAINKGYEKLLVVESDVFPPASVIEDLLYCDKKVVGALYDRDEGSHRKLCIQTHTQVAPRNIQARNIVEMGEGREIEAGFMDGSAKQVASVGMGCIMIDVSVLKKIPFRFDSSRIQFAPDALFSEDLFRNKIPIYANAAVMCEHRNDSSFWFERAQKETAI